MMYKYDSKFLEVKRRVFDTLFPKSKYDGCVMLTMSVIAHLWFADPAVVEEILKDQDVVRQRLFDRLDEKKIEEFVDGCLKDGWHTNMYFDAVKLYVSILTEEERNALIEDDPSDEVMRCD